MDSELTRLAQLYDEHCQSIEPRDGAYTFETTRTDNGGPHVEAAGGKFYYITTERRLELERRSTVDAGEILYWLLYDLTFWMAVNYEGKHRVPNQDARRVMFAQWLELMMRVDDPMSQRLEQDIATILARNPYDDSLGWS